MRKAAAGSFSEMNVRHITSARCAAPGFRPFAAKKLRWSFSKRCSSLAISRQ